jgi:hypothetical protein
VRIKCFSPEFLDIIDLLRQEKPAPEPEHDLQVPETEEAYTLV